MSQTYDDDCSDCRIDKGIVLCRLHRAAPELLAELKCLVRWNEGQTHAEQDLAPARRAIAHATGQD